MWITLSERDSVRWQQGGLAMWHVEACVQQFVECLAVREAVVVVLHDQTTAFAFGPEDTAGGDR
jgi:hypothetical protein